MNAPISDGFRDRCLRGLIALLIVAGVNAPGASLSLDYPSEVYAGESFNFTLRGEAGESLQVTLDDDVIAEAKFDSAELQLGLHLKRSGDLVFESGDARCELRIVSTTDDADFEERDGFLFSAGKPAILLLDHRHPPKHDRTWEGLRVFTALFSTPEDERIASQHRLGRLTATPGAFYDLDALILELPTATTDDLVLVQLRPNDLKHGLSTLSFRMRLEWILQKLEPQKRKQLLVVMIYEDAASWAQYKFIDPALRIACRAHSASYKVLRLQASDHASETGVRERVDVLLDNMFDLQAGP